MRVETADNECPKWRLPTRIVFRFVFAYFVLFFVPAPLEFSSDWISAVLPHAVPWLASHVLHAEILPIRYSVDSAESDSTYGVARTLLFLSIAGAIAVLWSIADRKREHYRGLYGWLWFYVRLILAWLLLDYGTVKLFPVQMRNPPLSTLLIPVGDLSPMSLLWLFMGSSRLYSFSCGAVEVLAALLLLIPRLSTLGALISAAAMFNVFLLNLGYDVVVKQFSLHMFFMAMFLLAPEIPRLANVLVWNRPVGRTPERMVFRRPSLNRALVMSGLAFGCYALFSDLANTSREANKIADALLKTPYYGVWIVDEFSLDGVIRPSLATDTVRWKRIVFDWGPFREHPSLIVHSAAGARAMYSMNFDSAKKSIVLRRAEEEPLAREEDVPALGHLTADDSQSNRLVLEGDLDGLILRAVLRRESRDFVLARRRFRWIQNRPFWGAGVLI
jgi:uncharacterized membrane protein YphA (DoxX/SURF4 family)